MNGCSNFLFLLPYANIKIGLVGRFLLNSQLGKVMLYLEFAGHSELFLFNKVLLNLNCCFVCF